MAIAFPNFTLRILVGLPVNVVGRGTGLCSDGFSTAFEYVWSWRTRSKHRT